MRKFPQIIDYYIRLKELRGDEAILRRLRLEGNKDVILIDARRDNKPSASKAA
jgi:hypothetical protein